MASLLSFSIISWHGGGIITLAEPAVNYDMRILARNGDAAAPDAFIFTLCGKAIDGGDYMPSAGVLVIFGTLLASSANIAALGRVCCS